MSERVRELTREQFRKLMGLIPPGAVQSIIRHLGRRNSWAPFRGQPDTFGPSLYQQLLERDDLSVRQVNSSRVYIMPRNRAVIVELIATGVIPVEEALIERAKNPQTPFPTYQSRAQAERAARQSVDRILPRAFTGREQFRVVQTPQQQREEAAQIAARIEREELEAERAARAEAHRQLVEEDPSAARFRALDLEDTPSSSAPDDEDDPSVQRFRLLDLD